MKTTHKSKRVFKIIGLIFITLLIINLTMVLVVKNQLPKIIEKNNDSAYQITFGTIGFSIFNGSFHLKNVKLTPKNDASIEKDIDFIGEVKEIKVTGVNFYKLLKNQNLAASTIYIDEPKIVVLKPTEKKKTKSESKKFIDKIDIDKIQIKKADLTYTSTDGKTVLNKLYNLNISLNGIHMGKFTIGKNIPFTYKKYNISIDSVYYNLNEIQHIKTGEILVNNDSFFMNDFKVLPEVDRKDFKTKNFNTNTRINLSVPNLQLKETDWGYNEVNEFYVKVNGIYIDSINLNILDQKKQTVFQEAKLETSKIIQPLIPFPLKINEIDIKNARFNSTNTLDLQNVHINIQEISNQVHNKLSIKKIELNNAQIKHQVLKDDNKPNQNPDYEYKNQLNDLILIENFKITNANYTLHDFAKNKNIINITNFNLNMNKININDELVKQKIPFKYTSIELNTGKLQYNTGEFYDIYANSISYNQNNFKLHKLEMKSKFSRKKHVSKLKFANDIYAIKADEISVKNIQWHFDSKNIFNIKADELNTMNLHCNIYRSTLPPTEIVENHLYSKKLRDLSIGLKINKIKIKNSLLEYEEEDANSISPGKLSFANFNAQISNVVSGYSQIKVPNTLVKVNTNFMNISPLEANWEFNVLNQSDAFIIKGNITKFPAKGMNPFIKPYIKVGADGLLNKVTFNFYGDKKSAKGNFGLNYTDLKVDFFDENGKIKNKVISKITNFVLSTNAKEKYKTVQINEVTRKKDTSFFNYLWLCILQGLKQTLITNTFKI